MHRGLIVGLLAVFAVACSGEEPPLDAGASRDGGMIVERDAGPGPDGGPRDSGLRDGGTIAIDAPKIVINEIMYHPPDHLGAAEFVELYNADDEPIALDRWFLDGIQATLPNVQLAPGAYFVLAENRDAFVATYGIEPDAVYTGGLRNSGELLALFDHERGLVDTVDYDDESPWPIAPDGSGPALELLSPQFDNAEARFWASGGPTPGGQNSVFREDRPPYVTMVSFPQDPDPNNAIDVIASVDDAASADLIVKIGFAASLTIPMTTTDGTAFTATLPGYAAGTLVRLRIEAHGATETVSWPTAEDSVRFEGTVVRDPAVTSALPIFHWFIEPKTYQAALDARFDRTLLFPAVFYFDGQLFDATEVRIKGDGSRIFDKNHWKFRLPRGRRFFVDGKTPISVDQFNLHSSYADKSYIRDALSYRTFGVAGLPTCATFPVRVHQNGAFYGLFTFIEDMDRDYLRRHGFDPDGAWYESKDTAAPRALGEIEGRYDKKARENEGYDDLVAFLDGVAAPTAAAYLLDNAEVPNLINYLAANVVVHNNDQVGKNFYLYRDSDGNERWSIQPWDMDLTFGRNYAPGEVLNDLIWADNDRPDPGRPQVSPSHPLFGDRQHQKWDAVYNRLTDAILADPTYRAMFYRRLRTLMDALLVPGVYEGWVAELRTPIANEVPQDITAWGQYGQPMSHAEALAQIIDDYLPRRRQHLFVTHRIAGSIPAEASPNPRVVINELHYRPAGGSGEEFVELFNASTEAVDLSGWRIDGVGAMIPPGTVILPNRYLIIVKSDRQFRAARGGGRFIPAVYDEVLDDVGETITLADRNGATVDRVPYDVASPWPALAPNRSLERIDPASDSSDPASWAESVVSGGTPGAPNGTP